MKRKSERLTKAIMQWRGNALVSKNFVFLWSVLRANSVQKNPPLHIAPNRPPTGGSSPIKNPPNGKTPGGFYLFKFFLNVSSM